MKKKWKRFRKTIYALSVVLCALVVSVSSSFFVSNAAENYYVNYVEPSCSDTQGYVALLLENNSTGARQVNVFFWCINQVTATSSVQVGMKLNITSSSCTFSPSVSTDDINYNISVIFAEQCYTLYKGVGGNSQVFSHTYTPTGYKILGAVYKGNVAHCTSASGIVKTFQIVWGSQKIELDALNSIYSELVKDYANDKVMLDKINSIMQSTASIEDKLDRLIELQEDTNSWLEEILEKLGEMVENASEEVKDKAEELNQSSSEQGDTLDSLNEQNKTDKVDVGSASGSVDAYIDGDAIYNYGVVLSTFTNDSNILKMIMTVLSVSLVAYVLFGKR